MSERKKFTVKTARYKRTVSAINHRQAAILAFIQDPPQSGGILTEIVQCGKHDSGADTYILTTAVLEMAGYTIEP